jgi:hypothetical protein
MITAVLCHGEVPEREHTTRWIVPPRRGGRCQLQGCGAGYGWPDVPRMYLGGPRAHDRFNHVLDVLDYAMQGRTGVSLGASLAGRRAGRPQRSEDRTGPATSGGGRRPHLSTPGMGDRLGVKGVCCVEG